MIRILCTDTLLNGPKNGGVECSAAVSIKAAVQLEYRRSEQLSWLTLTRMLLQSEKKPAMPHFYFPGVGRRGPSNVKYSGIETVGKEASSHDWMGRSAPGPLTHSDSGQGE